MAAVKKTKTIHYKSAVVAGETNLQHLLDDAVGAGSIAAKAANRQQKLNEEEASSIFINRIDKYNGMTIGQLVFLEAGKHQPYITLDDTADFYSINAMSSDLIPHSSSADKTEEAKEIAKKRREFIDSILYFGALNNHVVIIQSAALSSRHLEAHLSWLLGTCTGVLEENSCIVLQDKPSESVFKKLEQTPAKSIQIGAPLTTDASPEPAQKNQQIATTSYIDEVQTSKVRYTPVGIAASVIDAILPETFKKHDLKDSLDDANIKIALEITYDRKTTKTGQSVIDQIATSLRHSHASDVTINLQGGGKITGTELKLSGNVRLEFMDSGLVNEATLFYEMHKWLYSKISTDEIDANNDGG